MDVMRKLYDILEREVERQEIEWTEKIDRVTVTENISPTGKDKYNKSISNFNAQRCSVEKNFL